MLSISVLTALLAGLLVLISFAQPAADRLHLPYTVLLAILGTAVASLASFLLYTPLTDAFNEIAEPLVKFPINASVLLVVFSCCYWPRCSRQRCTNQRRDKLSRVSIYQLRLKGNPADVTFYLKGRRNDYRCDKRWEFLRHD